MHTNHHAKLTNQLFDDSLNASATFVAVVSSLLLLVYIFTCCVDDDVVLLFLSLDIPHRFHLVLCVFPLFFIIFPITFCKNSCNRAEIS
jgi:hypothetical protein